MNDEFTLQDLIDSLVKRHEMEQADADAFVRLFFSLIEEGLSSDRYVKIRGLGTFKFVETRITFTPESAMKELVNKPFSHFETVALNDNVHFDDMQENDSAMSDKTEVDDEAASEENMPAQNSVEVSESEQVEQLKTKNQSVLSVRLPWCMILSVLLVGAIVGGFMVWSMFRASTATDISTTIPVERAMKIQQEYVTDTIAENKSENNADADTLKVPQINSQEIGKGSSGLAQKEETIPLSDAVSYRIIGTRATHQLQYGETLVKLALKYYGNKKLWPYIARYNQDHLKNADDIHVGTMIRIPDLSPEKTH